MESITLKLNQLISKIKSSLNTALFIEKNNSFISLLLVFVFIFGDNLSSFILDKYSINIGEGEDSILYFLFILVLINVSILKLRLNLLKSFLLNIDLSNSMTISKYKYKLYFKKEAIKDINNVDMKYYEFLFLFGFILVGEYYQGTTLLGDVLFFLVVANRLNVIISEVYVPIERSSIFTLTISKSLIKRNDLETYLIEIKANLDKFNYTSIFRRRMTDGLIQTEDAYIRNKDTLDNLTEMSYNGDLISKLNSQNKFIEEKLYDVLSSIIEYNNSKNEIILENVERNMSLLSEALANMTEYRG